MIVDRTRETAAAEALIALRPKAALPFALLRFCKNQPLGAVGAAVLIFAIFVALAAPVLAPHEPTAIAVAEKFSLPFDGQLLGTDELGRDVLRFIVTMIQAVVVIIGLSIVTINLMIDLLYGWLDPRIRFA